jgi:hypothetical protein
MVCCVDLPDIIGILCSVISEKRPCDKDVENRIDFGWHLCGMLTFVFVIFCDVYGID